MTTNWLLQCVWGHRAAYDDAAYLNNMLQRGAAPYTGNWVYYMDASTSQAASSL